MKPFIRWAGSKAQLVRRLRRYWPGGDARYFEPFVGSACLFFEIEPQQAFLGDLNWELITTYREVKTNVENVVMRLRELPNDRITYHMLRSRSPETLEALEVAVRFLYLNRFCFNGLFRTNSRGEFNVPYARPKSAVTVDWEKLFAASQRLRSVKLLHCDFEETAGLAQRGDFVFFDPPYAISSRRVFSEYLSGSFSTDDLTRLGQLLERLNSRGVRFLLTYGDSAEARRLLAPWNACRIRVRRNIAGFVRSRRFSYELLAANFPVKDELDAD